jgi:sec-independent protein translocase protein TatA
LICVKSKGNNSFADIQVKELLMDIGPTELIIILAIIIVLFGVGRIGKIAGELGSGIRAFKEGLQGDEKKEEQKDPATLDKPV